MRRLFLGVFVVIILLLSFGIAFAVRDDVYSAAMDGNLALVKKHIESNPSLVNRKNVVGRTPIFFAASHGHADIVNYLISKGAKVNVTDNNGNSPLHSAATGRDLTIIDILISRGARINSRNKNGETPLLLAVSGGTREENINRLLSRGADVNSADSRGETPLIKEIKRAHKDDIIILLVSKGANVNKGDAMGNTPLHYAVRGNDRHLDRIKYLVSHGANVNAKNKMNQTPMEFYQVPPHSQTGKYLISMGAGGKVVESQKKQPHIDLPPQQVVKNFVKACETGNSNLLRQCVSKRRISTVPDKNFNPASGYWKSLWPKGISISSRDFPDNAPDGTVISVSAGTRATVPKGVVYAGKEAKVMGTFYLIRENGQWKYSGELWHWVVSRMEIRRMTR